MTLHDVGYQGIENVDDMNGKVYLDPLGNTRANAKQKSFALVFLVIYDISL